MQLLIFTFVPAPDKQPKAPLRDAKAILHDIQQAQTNSDARRPGPTTEPIIQGFLYRIVESSIDALSQENRINFDPFPVSIEIVSYTCLDGPLRYGPS